MERILGITPDEFIALAVALFVIVKLIEVIPKVVKRVNGSNPPERKCPTALLTELVRHHTKEEEILERIEEEVGDLNKKIGKHVEKTIEEHRDILEEVRKK